MRNAVHFGFGLVLIISAISATQSLIADREVVKLAAVAPAIIAAAAFGAILIARVVRGAK